MSEWMEIDWKLFHTIKTINWNAVNEENVRRLAKDRFGDALRKDISFEDLCEEMGFYDKLVKYKTLKNLD